MKLKKEEKKRPGDDSEKSTPKTRGTTVENFLLN
jgi:hypothetical protein